MKGDCAAPSTTDFSSYPAANDSFSGHVLRVPGLAASISVRRALIQELRRETTTFQTLAHTPSRSP